MNGFQLNWRDLIKPQKPQRDEKEATATYAKIVCEPLERGFGTTIGNSLRRILLSSLRGAAVSTVRFEGVLHEFSTVPGVVEDSTDVILNLKELRLRLADDCERAIARIDVDREGPVRARDIVTGPEIDVLNPDQHIATIGKGGRLRAELVVRAGRGYESSDRNKEEDAPVGTIPIDSLYSPVRRVNFTVTNARVGQRTDYDKLTLEIWTDASIRPEDALAYAARILQDQIQVFVTFDEPTERAAGGEEVLEADFNEHLFKTVDELDLSVRSANCLQNADVRYIGELVQRTEPEMLKTKNFGRKSLNEIRELLSDMGLGLGMRLENFPTREDLERRRLQREAGQAD